MSDPDDLSFDPRSWVSAPGETQRRPVETHPLPGPPQASRALLAGLAAAAILLTGAAAAFVTRSAPTQAAGASGGLSR